ncbi:putative 1-phosphatidylinositol-3-phosphate 5-kinase FAB1D isoform X2 [Durio zibethinus]|uniref:1-phosphatidylinositol-3-phosphate 5-kinase n=1 Tax=Durio zibethinus TaxID=66656 RepID=A0A6P5WQB0_DURZI|nr:putative 1-phosphatidylinositol-3-phosphate 5-kinase FAB1D isoform X2 [Durio zibethinus]
MCSMCHYCGAKLMKYNEDQRKQNSNALISSSGDPVWSCKLCWERQGREFVNREGISPFATPMISPTTSLSSSDQSNSGCSDFSVDINSYDCGEGEQDVGSNNSHGELNCLPNGRLQHLSSESPRKRVDSSNMMTESNLRDKKNTNDMDIVRDVEITEASNEQEAKENVVENSPRTINKESGVSQSINVEMDTQIWEPPEPEDPEDDLEGAMAYDDDDDDDECGDGTKWGKPSSLSRTKDEGNGSHRFKEEKQRAMKEVINGKVKAIVSQLLKSVGVACSMNEGDSWVDIVTSLSWEAALFLKPDAIDGKAMGPDGYVKVKCIATGSHSQSQLIKGLVFKKHAAHKHMQTKYKNPRLLLIQGVLGQSSSGLSSFSSLDEEKVHLKSLSEMIDMYHPNVILVEKTVSRGVQEFILAKGITLVFDMKLHRLERVARCTGLPIIPSDTLMNQKLKLNDSFKQCDSFHIEKFAEEHACFGEGGKRPSKTLMFLEGCPKRLGCTKSRCAICGELPEAHFYYYAHHNKQLTIQVKRLPKHLPGKAEGKLWMWSRCSKCKTGNGISKSTKRVLISTAAHSLSFGKFLELSFSDCSSSSRSSSCGHSHHRDFLYFFGLGPMVAMFSYSSVTTYTVSVPTQQLEFSKSIRQDWLKEEFENVHKKGMLMFREVASFLVQIRSQFVGSTLNLRDSLKEFFDVEEMLKQEASEFEVNIQNAVAKNGNANMGFHELLILNQLRWDLLLESCIWDRRLHSLLLPDPTVVIAGASNKAVLEQLISDMGSADGEDSGTETKYGNGDKGSDNSGKLKAGTSSFVERKEFSGDEFSSNIPVQKSEGCDSIHGNSAVAENIEKPKVDGVCPVKSSNLEFVVTPHISVRPHFDEKNYQAEDASLSDHLQVDRTIPISTDLAFNDSIVDSNGSRRGGSPRSLLSSLENLNGWFWMPFSEIRQMYMKDLLRGNVPKFESFSSCTPAQIPTGYQLIREEGSRLHIPLGTNDYIVSDYEGELSSIIACALVLLKDLPSVTEVSNEDGKRDRLIESLHSLTRVPMIASVHWSSSGSSDSDSVSSLSISSEESRFSSFDGLNLLDSRVPPDSLNIEVSLGLSKSLGKGKYSVVSLYANQFRDLRERCCPSELDYIASLSRCRKWDAKGGKSKSFFAKTLDDRFIIKEIKKTEYDSFEKFALHYFKYMNQSFETGSQTCLAKVLGIYQVIVRQPKTGKESRHDLKVMENLTFGRNITRQYDLKGALHARFSSGADGSGDVLLDQNFVNDMNSSPLYVSNKAKRILQRAVWNDTTFLNSINVMDYSLLVGVDTQRRELVCGIIDYLRQYTWDKQLETWVKSSLVVPKNVLPTVISPKEYKKRFRKFMSTYFLSVPDHWCSEESSDPSELCSIGDYDLSQSKSLKQPYLNDFPA